MILMPCSMQKKMTISIRRHDKVVSEFSSRLAGYSDQEIAKFFNFSMWFSECYANGYELEGPIRLVLDNSIIQSFKHRDTDRKRGLHALAYIAFCRFVTEWSDRPTVLALSPAAIYEHVGRRSPVIEEAHATLLELQSLFAETKLPVATLGFSSITSLLDILRDIEADDDYLTQYVRGLDNASWKTDLRAPVGIKIPLGIAYDAIPDDLPMRYFDPWYVQFVLSGRVEQHIIEQSRHDPSAMPISSGDMTKDLADLNEFSRKGLLKGLGDIDMLQICDVQRQYQQNLGYVLLGQTLDCGLSTVLSDRHRYIETASFWGGDPFGSEGSGNAMKSNPFADQDRRAERIRPLRAEFFEALSEACMAAKAESSKLSPRN